MNLVNCYVSNHEVRESNAIKGANIRSTLMSFIKSKYPDFSTEDYISQKEYDKLRRGYLIDLISQEHADISAIENTVVNSIASNKILSENIEPVMDQKLTLGQRAADTIAEFGGSWKFIISFFVMLLVWIVMNAWALGNDAFDKFPFILLNLILSCLAAIQAPIIMMSQNRLEQKDRQRGENDYKVNLKAELEIQIIHEKIDHMSSVQNKRLLEIQQMQIEYMDDIRKELNIVKHKK